MPLDFAFAENSYDSSNDETIHEFGDGDAEVLLLG